MELTLRPETPADYRAVEALVREAFWNVHVPGCAEHYLLHRLRSSSDFLPGLSTVAEADGALAGHIAYTKARIETPEGAPVKEVLCFGPLSVLPALQGRGIGGALVRRTLGLARQAGHAAVVIYGDPRYYSRFGFHCGERYDIQTADGCCACALLALELTPGALYGCGGRFRESPDFAVDLEAVSRFDETFPGREKWHTASQDAFQVLAGLRYQVYSDGFM